MIELPDHWDLQRLKYVSQHIIKKRSPIDGDIKISPENVESDTGRVLDFYSDYDSEGREFLPGDILFNKLGAYLNKVVLTDFAGLSMGEMIVLRPRGIYPEYLSKVMTSKTFIDEINSLSEGVKLPRSPIEGIMNSFVPVPPPEEQKLISLYLDKKTEQIDSLVEKIQRKIELLKEQRESLINRCITKGLDPNVEMKDSGIEWIGEIPKHWKLGKLKYLINLITKGETPSNIGEDFDDNGEVRFLKGEDLIDGQVTPQGNSFISVDVHEKLKRSQLMKDDLLVVIAGTLGKCAVVPVEVLPANTNQAISLVRFKEGVDPVFVRYWFETSSCRNQISEFAVVAAQPNLSMEALGNITIPIISYDSQKEITLTLSKTTSRMDELLKKEATRIELLSEYRQSLISSVVTGKVRITEDMI